MYREQVCKIYYETMSFLACILNCTIGTPEMMNCCHGGCDNCDYSHVFDYMSSARYAEYVFSRPSYWSTVGRNGWHCMVIGSWSMEGLISLLGDVCSLKTNKISLMGTARLWRERSFQTESRNSPPGQPCTSHLNQWLKCRWTICSHRGPMESIPHDEPLEDSTIDKLWEILLGNSDNILTHEQALAI